MRFRDQFKTFAKKTLLNFLLTTGEELIGITWLEEEKQRSTLENGEEKFIVCSDFWWNLFDDGIDVDHIIFIETIRIRSR